MEEGVTVDDVHMARLYVGIASVVLPVFIVCVVILIHLIVTKNK